MIQGTENMDRSLSRPSLVRRLVRRKGLWLLSAALVSAAVMVYPSASRWARSERSVELSRLRLATVERGDLERDVAVEGRIVAAFHPTVFSPAQGLVHLEVELGGYVNIVSGMMGHNSGYGISAAPSDLKVFIGEETEGRRAALLASLGETARLGDMVGGLILPADEVVKATRLARESFADDEEDEDP